MCVFSKGGGSSAPAVEPTPLPPVTVAPISADETAQAAGDEEKRRLQAAASQEKTVLTSGLGATGTAETKSNKLGG